MYTIDIKRILRNLDEKPTGKTADYFSEMFAVSVPTVKNMIKNYNDVLPTLAGVKILGKSGRGNGYFLDMIDQGLFNVFLQDEIKGKSLNFNKQPDRIQYVINQLIFADDFIKADLFIEALSISRSQFSRDLGVAKKILSSYEIQIIDRPHYGLKVKGDEINIRRYLANQANDADYIAHLFNIRDMNGSDMERVMANLQEILITKSTHYDYHLSDITCKNLMIHLLVAISRIDENLEVTLESSMIDSLRNEIEFPLAVSIVEEVQKQFNVLFNDDEVYYIVMHLSSKKIINDENFIVDTEVQQLVDQMIDEIDRNFGINLKQDLNLRIMLALHIVPLLTRIKYNTTLSNPLLNQIKENLWVAYEIAICVSEVINRQYQCTLSEDETAYFALHLKVALNHVQTLPKKRILLVCATGRGSAELLKSTFIRKFDEYIETLVTCDILELQNIPIHDFDYIFTVLPIDLKVSIPIFRVTYFMDIETEQDIKDLLTKEKSDLGILDFFEKTYFYTDISGSNRHEIIHNIVERLKQEIELPDGFEAMVLERERLSSTDYGNGVAFPHPNKSLQMKRFMSIALLNKPILWEKNKVQFIILSSFEKGFVKSHGDVMHAITTLITNKALVQRIIEEPTYDHFIEVIKTIC